jgi:hypothetical protein
LSVHTERLTAKDAKDAKENGFGLSFASLASFAVKKQ